MALSYYGTGHHGANHYGSNYYGQSDDVIIIPVRRLTTMYGDGDAFSRENYQSRQDDEAILYVIMEFMTNDKVIK